MIRVLLALSALSLPSAAADCEGWAYQGLRPGQDVAAAAVVLGQGTAGERPGRDLVGFGVDEAGRRWAVSAIPRQRSLEIVTFRILSGDESSIDDLIGSLAELWGAPVVDREEPAGPTDRVVLWMSRPCDVTVAASKRPSEDRADWELILRLARGEDWPVRQGDCDLAVHTPGVTATRPVAVPGAPVSVPAGACGPDAGLAPVIVELVARSDGSVDDVKVRAARGTCVRQAALDASRSWRYLPGVCGGRPVDVRMMLSLMVEGR